MAPCYSRRLSSASRSGGSLSYAVLSRARKPWQPLLCGATHSLMHSGKRGLLARSGIL